MKYAIKKGSGAVIHIPRFIKIGSGIQKLRGMGGIYGRTDSMVIA
jgi:hypothetical protein